MTSTFQASHEKAEDLLDNNLEICQFCGRPLCPFCWNHTDRLPEDSQVWECSSSTCRHQFNF